MAKVEIVKKTVRGLGSSDTAALQSIFPTTPSLPTAQSTQYTDESISEIVREVIDMPQAAIQNGNPDFPDFDPNFAGAPDLQTVSVAGDGTLIWNHYSPPPGSPGTPLAFGESAAKAVTTVPDAPPRSSGMGSTKSPSESSQQISTQFPGDKGAVAGNLIKGKSGATP